MRLSRVKTSWSEFQEDANRGKPNWEHLADDLHVLLTVEDTENRAKLKLARAVEEVRRLLIPVSELILHLFRLYIYLLTLVTITCV